MRIPFVIVVVISVFWSLSARTEAQKKDFEFQYEFSLQSRRFEEVDIEKSTLIGPHLRGLGLKSIGPYMELYFDVELIQEFGNSQTRFGENIPANGIYIRDTYFALYNESHKFQFGLINQGFLENELLVSDQPFPGLLYFLNWNSFRFFIELALPTSLQLKSKTSENEADPSFTVTGILYRHCFAMWCLQSHLGHYQFHSLPSKTALDSAQFGNSVTIISSNQAEFDYKFKGYFGKIDMAIKHKRLTYGLDFKVIKNVEADTGSSLGQKTALYVEVPIYEEQQKLTFFHYFNETDTSVASFNSYPLGHNNRKGFGVGVHLNFNSEFSMEVQFVDVDVINRNFIQEAMTYTFLGFNYQPKLK